MVKISFSPFLSRFLKFSVFELRYEISHFLGSFSGFQLEGGIFDAKREKILSLWMVLLTLIKS